MVIAQNMNIQSLFLNRFLGEVGSHRGEIESALALGATPDNAAAPYLRASFHASLIPAVDNLRSLGIVWIPGIMTGMMLSGSSPLYAALYQFVVLGMIFTAGGLSCLTATYLAPRRIFTPQMQLRQLA
jgi:putative ABC transport system permease protein